MKTSYKLALTLVAIGAVALAGNFWIGSGDVEAAALPDPTPEPTPEVAATEATPAA